MSDDNGPSPLQAATLDEIVDELAKRFDAVIVTGVRERTSDEEERVLDWRGSPVAALGLLDISRHRVLQSFDSTSRPLED